MSVTARLRFHGRSPGNVSFLRTMVLLDEGVLSSEDLASPLVTGQDEASWDETSAQRRSPSAGKISRGE